MPAWQLETTSIILLAGSIIAMGMAGFAFSGSRKGISRAFALYQLGVFAWCFAEYLLVRSAVPSFQFAYYRLTFIGVLIVPPAALGFAAGVAGKPLGWKTTLALLVVPITMSVALLQDGPGLLWVPEFPPLGLRLSLRPAFWLLAVYSLLLLGVLLFILIKKSASSRGIVRRLLRHTLAVLLLPIAAAVVRLAGILSTASPIDPFGLIIFGYQSSPASIGLVAATLAVADLFLGIALRGYNILDEVPFAKDLVFDAIDDPILTFDGEGRVVGLNREATALFAGFAPAEGRLASELCPPIAALLGGGTALWAKGERSYSVQVRPVRRRFLTPTGAIALFRDVTEESVTLEALARREDSLRRYAFMVNASRDGMGIIDAEYRYGAVNEAFCIHAGRPRVDLVGSTVDEVWGESPYLERVKAAYAGCFEGRSTVLRMRHSAGGDGEVKDLELSFNPYLSGEDEVSHAVLVAKDVTDYIETQRQLTAARQRADAANDAKGSFLAAMSHEIRTPLNAIIGLTELSLREVAGKEERDNLETVLAAAHNLLDLINDILDLSKIEAGRMVLERVDFDLTVHLASVLRPFRFAADQKGLALSLEVGEGTPRVVAGDPVKLGQVVTNLVGNALKFTDSGGVTVRIDPLPPPSATMQPAGPSPARGGRTLGVSIAVRDTGMGIAADKQRLIFESFSQADSSVSRRFGGTGLGLAICRNLARLFGGDIEVESAPGAGSTFTLKAYFEPGDPSRVARPVEAGPAEAAAGRHPLDILVVEDNPVNAKVALKWLSQEGHRAEYAASASEAFAALATRAFDLVLLDLELPDFDGFEVSRRVRAGLVDGPSGSSVPIVAMTAHSGIETREACLGAGMDDYVGKPVDFVELAATLSRVARPATREFPQSPEAARKAEEQSGQRVSLINSAEPLRRIGGDNELYLEIIGIFAAEAAERAGALEAALARDRADPLRRLAHSLRGSAKTVGADELAATAARLEESLLDTSGEDWASSGVRALHARLLALLEASAAEASSLLPPGYVPPVEE